MGIERAALKFEFATSLFADVQVNIPTLSMLLASLIRWTISYKAKFLVVIIVSNNESYSLQKTQYSQEQNLNTNNSKFFSSLT